MSGLPSPKEIAEILDVIGQKVPRFITEMMSGLYSEETAQNMGKAVGAFYQQLIEAGFKPEDALAMTKDYLNTYRTMMDNIKFTN
ncbi:MAG: hypothetical protein ACE3NC_11190 [Candidatus Wallacebacter cryptica]|jgi:hypothetical protein|nr:hypothetical protein [Bacillota bacterium]